MARFYPAFVGDFHGSEGERQVYHALETLGDDYTVFHSYCWIGDGIRTAAQGEADFIVLHPRHGILAIEVKAGGIAYVDGAWQQTNRRTGETKIIYPFQQAEKSLQRVLAELRDRMSAPPLVGKAVWFTSVQILRGKPLPLESPRDIILDADDLCAPKAAFEHIYDFWHEILHVPECKQTPAEFQQTIRILQPVFRIVETIASVSAAVEQSTARLTNAQFALLEYLAEESTAAIHGAAGTGKSLLAAEKARMLAREGEKVLYLCFNEFLLKRLRSCRWDKNITIHNERTLAEELMADRHLSITTVLREFEEFLQNEFDDKLWKYPNIIIDEAQDFPYVLLEHLFMLAKGAFMSFMTADKRSFHAVSRGRLCRRRRSGLIRSWIVVLFSIATAAIRRRLVARCAVLLLEEIRTTSTLFMANTPMPSLHLTSRCLSVPQKTLCSGCAVRKNWRLQIS